MECSTNIDDQDFSSVVQSIIKAESASNTTIISSWEAEQKPCKHTLTLDQSITKTIEMMSIASCSCCELKTNLWLCLTCGNLGCGRKNYLDNSGGNNHGVNHFEQT